MNFSNYYPFDKIEVDKISELLTSPKRICILTHVNPDGDAIGSSLALANVLLKNNHEVVVITPNAMMGFLKWMKGTDDVISFQNNPEDAIVNIRNSEIIFCLDFNNPVRIEGVAKYLAENTKAIKILIDHHIDPKDFCQINFSFPVACSTAELIYCFIKNIGLYNLIDSDSAECLYCGIMTDSGNFRFNSVTPELHEITADLLRLGVDQNKVYELVYDSNSLNTLKIHGYVMAEKLDHIEESKAVIISLSDEEQKRFNVGKTEIDEIVNFGLRISGVTLSAFFYENDGKVRVSIRTKGNISAKNIVMQHFNGGGHFNAAGGVSEVKLEQTVLDFRKLISNSGIS